MISEAQIEAAITALRLEQAGLRSSYDQMVKDHQAAEQAFQQRVQTAQNRFQQIEGSLKTLLELQKNGKEPPTK